MFDGSDWSEERLKILILHRKTIIIYGFFFVKSFKNQVFQPQTTCESVHAVWSTGCTHFAGLFSPSPSFCLSILPRFVSNVCLYVYVVMREWWKEPLLGREKAEPRWQTDDRGDVWWHLISPITDMHPGKSTDAPTQNRGGKRRRQVGEGDTELSEVNTHPNTGFIPAPLFPEPSYPEVIPAVVARNFPPRICFAHFMTIIFLLIPRKVSFSWLMAPVVCEWKGFFFPPRPWVGVNEPFYVLPCRGLHYMFDVSRFVRD